MLRCCFALKTQHRGDAAIAVEGFSFFKYCNEFVAGANAITEADDFLVPYEITAQRKRTVTSEENVDDAYVSLIEEHQRKAIIAQQSKTFLQCEQSEDRRLVSQNRSLVVISICAIVAVRWIGADQIEGPGCILPHAREAVTVMNNIYLHATSPCDVET